MKESTLSTGSLINEEIKKYWLIFDTRTEKALYGIGEKTLLFSSKEVAKELADQMFFDRDHYLIMSVSKNLGL